MNYVTRNVWPSARCTDLADLTRQAQTWVVSDAPVRIQGTPQERPCNRRVQERSQLQACLRRNAGWGAPQAADDWPGWGWAVGEGLVGPLVAGETGADGRRLGP